MSIYQEIKTDIKSFLSSESGQKLVYEIKSFMMTLLGVLGALLIADPAIKATFDTGIIQAGFWPAVTTALSAATGRSIFIYVSHLFGLDYRQDTTAYGKKD